MAETTNERKSFFKRIRGQKKEESEMTFIDHLEALRWHIVRSVIAWIVCALIIFINIDWVFDEIIMAPVNPKFITYSSLCRFGRWLHLGDVFCMPAVFSHFQATKVAGTFSAALNTALIGGIIAAFPYIFWEFWRFVKPALSNKEVKYARGSIFWVSICFFTGAAFGYYLLAPFTFNFLANFTLGKSGIIEYKPEVNDYIDTLTNIMLGCAIAFQLPILSYVLAKVGIITGTFLKKYFKFALVLILIISAIITPSADATSQFLVALPLTFLYWLSIVLASRVEKQRKKEEKSWK